MVLVNHEMHESPVDDMQSGTTAVNILVRGTGLYVANVGDSRAVLAEQQGGKNVAINLTVDQTAFRYCVTCYRDTTHQGMCSFGSTHPNTCSSETATHQDMCSS